MASSDSKRQRSDQDGEGPERPHLDESERKDVEERHALRAPVIYEIVRRNGEAELERPARSLWWSGVAAGFGISTSVVAEGLLHLHLPDNAWRPVLENFGYSLGFLIVVMGRLQLFTENTITVILPLFAHRTRWALARTARLWSIVFAANLIGCFAAAVLAVYSGISTAEQIEAFASISRHIAEKTPFEALMHGLPAGFFVAAMVWLLPSARGSEIWVIILLTYLIALGSYAHVVAGSTEVFLLFALGEITIVHAVFGFIAPAFLGNVLGGTGLFGVLAYAQVSEEMDPGEES
jgi:formate-nitrite transporter family protein